MKTKISKKDINSRFLNVLHIHDWSLKNLLHFKSPFAYSTRVEGWACDYYEVGTACLSSGDSPIGKKANMEIEKTFEAKAKKIMESNFFKMETKKKKIDALLLEFVNELINN